MVVLMSDNTYNSKYRDYKAQFQKKDETIARHNSMDCKVIELKVQYNKTNIQQRLYLSWIFVEAKWDYNSCIAYGKESKENKPWKKECKSKTVIHFDKDHNPIESEFKYLFVAARQEIRKQIGTACKSISTNLKKSNIKHFNGLKFKSEINSISLRQYGQDWKFKGHHIKLNRCKKPFKVHGLEQLNDYKGIEFANARLVKKPSGYYIQITCFVPKETKKRNHNFQTLGVDFGCETSFTTYCEETNKAEKLNFQFEQTENEKRIQRKLSWRLHKKFSNRSNNGLKLRNKLRKILEHKSNQKKDTANKLIHNWKQFELVVFQDEMLHNWQKLNHGKKIQKGILGKVKAAAKKLSNVFVLDSSLPTSKFCFDCFHKNVDLTLNDRTFICPNCGSMSDRDVHAARNMIEFYKLIMMVPTEYRNPEKIKALLIDIEKRVEMNPSKLSDISFLISDSIQGLSVKHEATKASLD